VTAVVELAAGAGGPAPTPVRNDAGRRVLRSVLGSILTFVALAALLLGLWVAFLAVLDIDGYFGKSPSEVWRWLTDADQGAARRRELAGATRVTMVDAAQGFLVGTAAAVVVAMSFVLSRAVERALLPIALALRSVPIVAMIPLLAYVFGRETTGTLVIIGTVVWFPVLVLVTTGLRSVRPESVELLRAYDASKLTELRVLRIPSALPALFASAKVAAPLAVLGSLLNGWLSTGTGLGSLMVLSTTSAQYSRLWAAVVVVTVASVLLAAVVSAVEQVVLARYAPDRLGR